MHKSMLFQLSDVALAHHPCDVAVTQRFTRMRVLLRVLSSGRASGYTRLCFCGAGTSNRNARRRRPRSWALRKVRGRGRRTTTRTTRTPDRVFRARQRPQCAGRMRRRRVRKEATRRRGRAANAASRNGRRYKVLCSAMMTRLMGFQLLRMNTVSETVLRQ